MQTRWTGGAVLALAGLMGAVTAPEAAAQRGRVTVPANTVIRLELAEDVSSRDARIGERVVATLDENDRSGFPLGTRFEGVVTDVRRARNDRPAILDMEFRTAVLPNGRTERIRGDLVSLSEDEVRSTGDGRLESRRSDGSFDWKWVGYGAAGGAVLGEILGDDFLKGGLLGGLGGAIYGYLNRDRDGDGEFSELTLDRGTEFGIRLDRSVAFNPERNYRFSERRVYREQVAGARDEAWLEPTDVRFDGRPLRFTDARPMRVNGTVYLPVNAVADAADWDLAQYVGSQDFVLRTPKGRVTGSAGETRFTMDGRSYTLDAEPMMIGGRLYVPMEFVSRAGDMQVDWDRRGRRLNLTPLRTVRPASLGGGTMADDLFAGLTTLRYPLARADVRTLRVVDADRAMTEGQIQALVARVNENATARRNRNLMTDLLRDTERISNQETVIGVSRDGRTVYVTRAGRFFRENTTPS